jgi:hypothetical protein
VWPQYERVIAIGEYYTADTRFSGTIHCLAEHLECLVADFAFRGDVIRRVEIDDVHLARIDESREVDRLR